MIFKRFSKVEVKQSFFHVTLALFLNIVLVILITGNLEEHCTCGKILQNGSLKA